MNKNKTLLALALMSTASYAAFTAVDTASLAVTRGFSIIGDTNNDELGYTVSSAGDFNNDDRDDLLITTSNGLAYVVFGKATSQAAVVFDLADSTKTTTDFITISATTGATEIVGAEAGDVNNDDVDDIIIGVPGVWETDAGQAYVIYGKTTPTNIDLNTPLTTGSNGFSFATPGDNLGFAVAAAGDINNDDIDDLVISGPGTTGSAFVILGTQGARTANVDLASLVTDGNGFVITGATGSNLGYSVAGIDDVNNDDRDDIIVGAPGEDAAYIIYGVATASLADVDVTDTNDAARFAKITGVSGSRFGHSVALAEDFNVDGRDDIIIGAPLENINTLTGAGRAYIIFGQAVTAGADIADITVSSLGTQGITISGAAAGDGLGWSVAGVDDLNDDGVDDIVITAYGSDDATRNTFNGRAYVLFGRTNIASIDLATALTSTVGVTITGPGAGTEFGKSVSAIGDINGDDNDDIVISAPKYSPVVASVTRTEAGAAYVIYGVNENSSFRIGASISIVVSFLFALLF
jgi:hypothetical protein